MGNYRFRLSDMLPNAWFYKLKDMSKTKSKSKNRVRSTRSHSYPTTTSASTKKTQTSSSSLSSSSSQSLSSSSNLQTQRKSYHISRINNSPVPSTHQTTPSHDPKLSADEPPRKSSKKRRSTTGRRRTSPVVVSAAACSCRTSHESVWTKPDSTPEDYPNSPSSSSSSNSSEKPSILTPFSSNRVHNPQKIDSCRCDFDTKNAQKIDSVTEIEIDLPPIITKPEKFKYSSKITIKKKTEHRSIPVKEEQRRRVSVSSSNGVKLRTISPRIVSTRKIIGARKSVSSRKSVTESFAVVKSSDDPQKDFRESMVEMIMENNLRSSKDLEELLACYLSLNSDEYHYLIIKVFKQIWFDITDIRLK